MYLARESPTGVVLRRGPSDWSRLSLWHTDTDAFEHGQWLRGRVYPRRCDVSPDGSLLAYFVHKATGAPDVAADSWAAISRPPYFTALALWPIGTTYFAGGYFIDSNTLWMSGMTGAPEVGALPKWMRLADAAPHVDRTPEWTDRTVRINRLLRDGWTPEPSLDVEHATWERTLPRSDATLILQHAADAEATGSGGRDVDDVAIRHGDGPHEAIGRCTWADVDRRGRVVYARDGAIFEWRSGMIMDFNGMLPDPQPAAAWASSWPRR